MMLSANPFSPGKPVEYDHQFIDQERVIKAILRCLNKGRSCSIIGGVGMGKTSILLRIKRLFSQKADAIPTTVFHFIPIYFKPDLQRASSLGSIYQQLIDETISQTKDWLMNCVADVPKTVFEELDLHFSYRLTVRGSTTPDEDCRAFEGDLWEIIKSIRHVVANTKLLFLLDEMYRIEEDTKEALARHWFELLDEENLHKETLRTYLAVIITCFRDHLEQFISRRPDVGMGPIRNAIEPIYLHVFERADAWQVMKPPFKDAFDLELTDEVADEIYSLTGGHPLLLQSAMSDLWSDANTGKAIDSVCVQSYAPTWSTKHPEMYRWIGDIIYENQMLRSVFELLAEDEIWEQTQIIEALKGLPVSLRYAHQLRDALQMLKSLGVVRETRKYTYQISGGLFREWFKPLSAAQVDEMNYRSQIDELEDQITRTIDLLDQHRDIERVVRIRERLKEELATLGTDLTQLIELEEALTPENPMRADAFRRLIKDVQRIRYYMRFEIRPQLRELGIQMDDIGDNLVA